MRLQRVISTLYPDQCLICDRMTSAADGLCAECWPAMPFIFGHSCDACGRPLPGTADGGVDYCDDCLILSRSWSRGRAALSYQGAAREFVLSLKHRDRPELARPAARWMARVGRPILTQETILMPIPIHWSRLLSRRYNQAAELVRALRRETGLRMMLDALQRNRRTPPLGHSNHEERAELLAGAISVKPERRGDLVGQRVCLVDDVMTTGATLSAAAEACSKAGADDVTALILARAGSDA